MHYTANITREGKHWLATFPDAPGCQTFADSEQALRGAAEEALTGWLEAHLVNGRVPPKPRVHRNRATTWDVCVPLPLSIALQVRWARQKLGLSQQELARRADVSQQQIARVENPAGNPTLRTLLTVSKAMDVTLHLTFETLEGKKRLTKLQTVMSRGRLRVIKSKAATRRQATA